MYWATQFAIVPVFVFALIFSDWVPFSSPWHTLINSFVCECKLSKFQTSVLFGESWAKHWGGGSSLEGCSAALTNHGPNLQKDPQPHPRSLSGCRHWQSKGFDLFGVFLSPIFACRLRWLYVAVYLCMCMGCQRQCPSGLVLQLGWECRTDSWALYLSKDGNGADSGIQCMKPFVNYATDPPHDHPLPYLDDYFFFFAFRCRGNLSVPRWVGGQKGKRCRHLDARKK